MAHSVATWWWVAAGVLVAAELATGTVYLLMLASGLIAGAIAAHLGLGTTLQIVAAAVVGVGATAAWHWRQRRQSRSPDARENRDVNLDIGEPVKVGTWASDRTTRVHYRGSTWAARLSPGAAATPGDHIVSAVEGNWLVLTPR
jgi:membrane protein implicated in regulation of membrane protease activity